MALTPAERSARHKAKRKEQMLEMIRTGAAIPPKKKFTEAQLAVRRSQLAKRMKEKQEMIEEKIRKGEPVHIPYTHAERQAQYRARKKQKELETMMKAEASAVVETVEKKRPRKSIAEKMKTEYWRENVSDTQKSAADSEQCFGLPFAPIETFVIKSEPVNDTIFMPELIYCRCCFKMLSNNEIQYLGEPEILQTFHEITQLTLEPSQLAPNFCEDCFNDIISFSQFKQLATLKQQKFNEIVQRDVNVDINNIHGMKLNMDPFHTEIKEEEDYDNQVMKQKYLSVEINSFDKAPVDKQRLMDQHIIKKHLRPPQPRICQICGNPFINLERHIMATHEKSSKCVCDLCGYVCYNRANAEFHMRSWHLEKEFKCVTCGYATFTQERLDKHLLAVHNKEKIKKVTNPEDLKCRECNKVFTSKNSIEAHVLRIHRKRRDFGCDKCHKSFFTSCDLKQHKDHIHNKAKGVICEICGKAFPMPRFLRSHMVRHSKPQYSCEICGMTFFYKSLVKRHIDNLHLNVFSHVCTICNKGFRDSQKLKYHNLKHVGIKFHCYIPGCTSTTSRPDALRFHMKHSHSLSPDEQSGFLKKLEAYYIEVMNKVQ